MQNHWSYSFFTHFQFFWGQHIDSPLTKEKLPDFANESSTEPDPKSGAIEFKKWSEAVTLEWSSTCCSVFPSTSFFPSFTSCYISFWNGFLLCFMQGWQRFFYCVESPKWDVWGSSSCWVVPDRSEKDLVPDQQKHHKRCFEHSLCWVA